LIQQFIFEHFNVLSGGLATSCGTCYTLQEKALPIIRREGALRVV